MALGCKHSCYGGSDRPRKEKLRIPKLFFLVPWEKEAPVSVLCGQRERMKQEEQRMPKGSDGRSSPGCKGSLREGWLANPEGPDLATAPAGMECEPASTLSRGLEGRGRSVQHEEKMLCHIEALHYVPCDVCCSQLEDEAPRSAARTCGFPGDLLASSEKLTCWMLLSLLWACIKRMADDHKQCCL